MRRKLSLVVLFSLLFYSIFSQVGAQKTAALEAKEAREKEEVLQESKPKTKAESKLIDLKANIVYPHKINDTLSVLCLVGDFAAQHNGAVITADSAVRFENQRLECYGNVLINKNTTYAYANRADYDGSTNTAKLFSPIIKVVDEDVTLYTYNFSFNTLDNIGEYSGGGVTIKQEQIKEGETEPSGGVTMESLWGYYYADDKRVVGVREVEIRGEGYELRGDSVIYEMERERAHFFRKTNIWNEDGEYLYGDRGLYDKAEGLYSVTLNGYMLRAEQEIWSDSLDYFRDRREAILRDNIQIDDTTNKMLAFGDFAHYWDDIEKVLLTRRPTIVNYDPKEVDSLFLSGDTIMVLSYAVGTGPIVDSAEIARIAALKARIAAASESVAAANNGSDGAKAEETSTEESAPTTAIDTTETITGFSLSKLFGFLRKNKEPKAVDSVALQEKMVKDSTKQAAKALRAAEAKAKSDLKAAERETKRLASIDAQNARDFRKLTERKVKVEERLAKNREKGRNTYSDSVLLHRIKMQISELDGSKKNSMLDSLSVIDSLKGVVAQLEADSIPERDSLYRILKVYNNTKSYRRDFQTICDSMVGVSYDTTLRLYISPVMWSDNNQIASQQADIYTKDGNLDFADFTGDPIMASEVYPGDSVYYNQVSGKTMRAFFENNNVTRNDVDGNVQTIYFLQDDKTKEVNTIAKIESGSATFHIKDRELDGVTYRSQPTYVFAPLDKMPDDLSYYLTGFKWYGAERPTRSSILDRKIRPTRRKEIAQIPTPQFPIMQELDSTKVRLTREKRWFERIERVSPDVVEWMRELGFEPEQPREDNSF